MSYYAAMPSPVDTRRVDALQAWGSWRLALAGDLSPDTLRNYVPAVLRFLALSDLARAHPEVVTRQHVLAFYAEFVSRGRARVQMHYALVSFFRWCEFEGLLVTNPMASLKPRRTPEARPLALTREELARLLAAMEALRGRRAALSVQLGYLLGLRRKEVCGLRWADIIQTEDGPAFRLTETKGDRPREVPISGAAAAVLVEMRSLWPRYMRKDRAHLVVGITRSTFSEWVHRAAVDAGIPLEKAHSHVLRATFATNLLRGGVNVRVVQELLGHASLVPTVRYLETSQQEMRQAVELLGLEPGA